MRNPIIFLLPIFILISTFSFGQLIVKDKDSTPHTLLQVNDEGVGGSLTLPNIGISLIGGKLYNNAGNLFWDNNQLNGVSGASVINDLGDAIYDGSSLFLGEGSGRLDDGTTNQNTGVGKGALFWNTTGSSNTAIGKAAMALNETGIANTATGGASLYSNKSGSNNIAYGYAALNRNTGNNNTANGAYALYHNSSGNNNTAVGYQALYTSVGLNNQTACGYQALYSNTSGINNTAFGASALYSNTLGYYNSANGASALYLNTIGLRNTANGAFALYSNTEGNDNVAIGYEALNKNTTGGLNIAIGAKALYANIDGYFNTANGKGALSNNTTGSENTAVGYYSGPSSSNLFNTTSLGCNATVSSSHTIRIGNSSIISIGGYADWSDFSDGRYKNNIYEDVVGIDFIMGLRPITYNLDLEKLANKLGENIAIDENGNRVQAELSSEMVEARQKKASKREVGFVAQEVEELSNRLGFEFSGVEVPENEQSMYRLRYAEFVVPLVKAMQEQQEMIEELRAEINELKRNSIKQ